jgi:hypothetical protein
MIFKRKETKPKAFRVNQSGSMVRRALALVFLALTVFVGFYILPLLYEQKANTGMVVVAAVDIGMGEVISADHLSVREIGVYGFSDYYTDAAEILGMVAITEIKKSDIILDNKITEFDKNSFLALVNDTRGLLTITVSTNAAGLASHLKSGAIVNVYNIIEEGLEIEEGIVYYGNQTRLVPVLNPLLENLEVYSIENSNVERVGEKSSYEAEILSSYSANTNIVSTITFYTESKEQEIELLKAEYDGIIHIALVEM